MKDTSILYERTFWVPKSLVKFINGNEIQQEQIVSIVGKRLDNNDTRRGSGNRGYHTVYFYHPGKLKYETKSNLSDEFIDSVKSDRRHLYQDGSNYSLFPSDLMNEIEVDELEKLLKEINH